VREAIAAPRDLRPGVDFGHDGGRLRETIAHGQRTIEQRGRVEFEIVLIGAEHLETIGDVIRLRPSVRDFLFNDIKLSGSTSNPLERPTPRRRMRHKERSKL
jgi:hypothetical protein